MLASGGVWWGGGGGGQALTGQGQTPPRPLGAAAGLAGTPAPAHPAHPSAAETSAAQGERVRACPLGPWSPPSPQPLRASPAWGAGTGLTHPELLPGHGAPCPDPAFEGLDLGGIERAEPGSAAAPHRSPQPVTRPGPCLRQQLVGLSGQCLHQLGPRAAAAPWAAGAALHRGSGGRRLG